MKITDLTLEHENLFQKYISKYRPNSFRFENSWLYILQACRKKGKLVQINENIGFIGENSENSNISIVNYLGDLDNLSNIAKNLKDNNKKVIYKNATFEEVPVLIKNGFRRYYPEEKWSHDFKYDDQTYPQQIVDLEELMIMSGKNYHEARRNLNFARKTYKIVVEDYSPDIHKESVKRLLEKQDISIKGSYESQQMFLDFSNNETKNALIYKTDDNILGFTIVDKISELCCAASGLIYDTSLKGFTILMYYLAAQKSKERGFSFMNFQGSETKSLDTWKRKFNPVLSVRNTHLIYEN